MNARPSDLWNHCSALPILRACLTWLGCLLWLNFAGCAFGPKQLERSHGRYNEAVRRVDEEQLLLNLVHMRYNEVPSRLDVSAIAAQYEVNAHAEARPFFSTEAARFENPSVYGQFTSILPFASVGTSNRPTISLTPADDGSTVRRFLTPIPSDTLLFLARTSWPVDTVLRLWVERMNGVPNADTASGPPQPVVPDFARFRRIAELLQLAQNRRLLVVRTEERGVSVSGPLPKEAVTVTGAVEAVKSDLECRPRPDGVSWELIRKEQALVLDITREGQGSPEVSELLQLLNLRPGQPRYDIVTVGGADPDPQRDPRPPTDQVRVVSRSTAQVYFYLANGVEVPSKHLGDGLATAPVTEGGEVFDLREVTRGLFEVRACKGHKPPAGAYLAVCYRDHWFYIDDSDQASKSTFALMLQLSRLDLARQRPTGPLLTLPVGR